MRRPSVDPLSHLPTPQYQPAAQYQQPELQGWASARLWCPLRLLQLQLQRATSSVDETITDSLQIGPFAVIAGGLVVLVARGR